MGSNKILQKKQKLTWLLSGYGMGVMSAKIHDFHSVTTQMIRRRECGDPGQELPLAGHGHREIPTNLRTELGAR